MDIFIDKWADIKMVLPDGCHLDLFAFLMKITAKLEDKALLPFDRQVEQFIAPVAGNPYLAFEIKMKEQQVFFFLNDQMQIDQSIPYLGIFKMFKERIINFKVELMRSRLQPRYRDNELSKVIHHKLPSIKKCAKL
jgi:hypothetical protein